MEASPDVNMFLFTDIEGSTSKWETRTRPHGAGGGAARRDRCAAPSRATADASSRPPATASTRCSPTPMDAVQAVVAFQLALVDPAATDGMAIRVRCGLHAGLAVERDGDFFGTTINRTARIMGVGHGGQVLLSAGGRRPQSATDCRRSCRCAISARVRLKDLAAPEQV